MIGIVKLEFYCGVLFIACLNIIVNTVRAEWKSTYNASYYNLISFPMGMLLDETLILAETEAATITSCVRFCETRKGVSLYYTGNICHCNSDLDTRLNSENHTVILTSESVYGYVASTLLVSTNQSTLKYDIQPYEESCFALYHHGYRTNGIYTVHPIGGNIHDMFCDMDSVQDVGADDCLHWLQVGYSEDRFYNIRLSNGTSIKAWCDQTGGGWTVIQRRFNGSVNFYRKWAVYVNGFGDPDGEYWLGLEAIYLLALKPSSLRVDMKTFGDVSPVTAYAMYNEFALMPVTDRYKLLIGAFAGNCSDCLEYHNNQQFSTFDSDNDSHSSRNCAALNRGGWWYNRCHRSNLNGVYYGGNYTDDYNSGMIWVFCWGNLYSVKTSTMSIKRN